MFSFPGNFELAVTYWLLNSNELKIDYQSKCDKATVQNLTNHAYFNLKGEGNGDILDHYLKVNSDKITEIDKDVLPTGKYLPIKGTALDFTKIKQIGKDINKNE